MLIDCFFDVKHGCNLVSSAQIHILKTSDSVLVLLLLLSVRKVYLCKITCRWLIVSIVSSGSSLVYTSSD